MIIVKLPRGSSGKVPATCTNLVVTSDVKQVLISWTDPEDEEKSIWAGTKLVRKEGSAPADWTDGTLLLDETTKNQYAESNYVDTTGTLDTEYYYAVFPYSTKKKFGLGTSATGIPWSRKPLSAYTWREIAEISDQIAAGTQDPSIFNILEEKEIIINKKLSYVAAIIGFNHDKTYMGGEKMGITFSIKNVNNFRYRISNDNSCYTYDFGATAIQSAKLPLLIDEIPKELRDCIPYVSKKSYESLWGNYNDIPCRAFINSESEIFGKAIKSIGDEGEQYEAYKTEEGRKKVYTYSSGSQSSERYWCRSTSKNNANSYVIIPSNGKEDSVTDGILFNNEYYSPCFCVSIPKKQKLEDYSWSEISEISKSGQAPELFELGDTKSITLSGSFTQKGVKAQIIGFDHDDLVTGGKAGITFIFKNCLSETTQMDNVTNNYDYTKSLMNTTFLPSVLECISDELTPYIQEVKKETIIYVGRINNVSRHRLETFNCKLFILSFDETSETREDTYYIESDNTYHTLKEGTIYPLFKDYRALAVRKTRLTTDGTEVIEGCYSFAEFTTRTVVSYAYTGNSEYYTCGASSNKPQYVMYANSDKTCIAPAFCI